MSISREQTTFFEQQVGDKRIAVLKTYDARFAREAFDQMTQEALETLAASLDLESGFDSTDIRTPLDFEFAEFLWEAIEEQAREDWDSFSYFIVREEHGGQALNLFVSSDWPSAETFAKNTLKVTA